MFKVIVSLLIALVLFGNVKAQDSKAYPVKLSKFSWSTLDITSFNVMFKKGGTDVAIRFFEYQRDWFPKFKRLGLGTSIFNSYYFSDPKGEIGIFDSQNYKAYTVFPIEASYLLYGKVHSFDAIDYWVQGNYYVWNKNERSKRQYISSLIRLKLMISAWGKTTGPDYGSWEPFEGSATIVDFSIQGYFFRINTDPMPIPGALGMNFGVRYINAESSDFSKLFDPLVFYFSIDIGFNGGSPGHSWPPFAH